MNEGATESAELPASNIATTPLTAGGLLRCARERQGLHIAALAVSMKVPVKKLEALEADRLDLLPDAVFARALAASVCRSLKIDAAPVLELLPSNALPRLYADDRGINTPFDVRGQASSTSLTSLLFKPPVLMVLVLLVAAVVVYFYPVTSKDATVSGKLQAVTSAVTPEIIPESAIESASGNVTMLAPSAPTQSTLYSAAVPANAASQQNAGNLTIADSSSVAEQQNLLQFNAKGNAWVQVTDAKGVQLLSRTLLSGEVVGVAGALPLAIVVGRVDLTTMELRGKPYDLTAIAQNNVARFEVKQ